MNRSYKAGLIALAILICVIFVVLLLNLESIKSSIHGKCFKLDGGDICHMNESAPYRYYGTKTVYDVAVGNRTSEQLDVSGCELKMLYILCRHSTRYPHEDEIVEMTKFLPRLKEKIHNASLIDNVKICKSSLENITNWIGSLKKEVADSISFTGEVDTMAIAERMKTLFPTLLDKSYSPDDFEFAYTSKERTRKTAEAFAKGLFQDISNIDFDNKTNDDVLRFHKECKKFKNKCDLSFFDTSEVTKFEEGPIMQAVVKSVSTRVGFNLTYDELKIIYRGCSFGYALGIGDTWCNLFSTDELKVLEFEADIGNYYKDGYGNQINIDQSCPAVKFVLDLFASYISGAKSRAVLHFSHSSMIKKVFSAFGLFKDSKPLRADDPCYMDRKWRSSLIAPFTANLALALYNCNGNIKVAAFHNEKPVQLAGCDGKLCPYKDFLREYYQMQEHCNIRRICCKCCKA